MLDVIGVRAQVIQGSLFTTKIKKKFSGSGLSIGFAPGRVGAIGLDFTSQDTYEYVDWWKFVLKIANPNSEAVVIERITFSWRGKRGFLAEAEAGYVTLGPVHPKAKLPDDGDTYLPRVVMPQSTEIIEVGGTMWLYKKKFLRRRKAVAYTRQNYSNKPSELHPNPKIKVTVKTNQGVTKLKA